MRLTLRTMLAYLDDILEPDDSADIGRKIEESEFASGLVQRTRECMRRARLGAPPPLARGMALDANTVAEYLDNTLSAERVPDFEKVCLESDTHLAEVAACHQILTLVLGEPAEVDPASRERMYHIAAEAELAAPPVAAAPAPQARRPDVPAASRRQRPEVPEYLRGTRGRRWPAAAVLIVIVALLTFGILMVAGPPELRERLLSLVRPADTNQNAAPGGETEAPRFAGDTPREPAADSGRAAPVEPSPRRARQDAGPEQPNRNVEPATTRTVARDGGPAAVQTPREGTAPAPRTATNVQPKGNGAAGEATRPATGSEQPPSGPPEPSPAVTATPPAAGPAPPDAKGNPAAAPAGGPTQVATTVAPGKAAPAPAGNSTVDGGAPAAAPPAPVLEELGRYTSDHDVLLVFDEKSRQWNRVAPRASMGSGDMLLTLPLYRPKVHLSNGIVMESVGATLMKLDGFDMQDTPGIAVDYGRVLLLTVGKAGNRIRLHFGERHGVLTFGDAESTAAVEVRRTPVAGADPETTPGAITAELYATSGKLIWKEDMAEKELAAPARQSLTDFGATEDTKIELPQWITSSTRNKLDENAATTLEEALKVDRPISLALKELTDYRQIEVRSLAIRSCTQLGIYEPALDALSDEMQRAERTGWPAYIDALRGAVARGPRPAADVHAAIEKKHGAADGREMFRMLWGYTGEDLKAGEAAKLVKQLNNDKLDFQVLSAWNLQKVTGISIRPEVAAAKRRAQVQRWSERLREGKIVPVGEGPRRGAGGAAVRKAS